MLLYRVDCSNCGAPRVGRKTRGDVVPILDACPLCGSTDYVVPSDESEDEDEASDESEDE